MGVLESSQLFLPMDGVMQKTWDDAVARWLIERGDKASLKSDRCIIGWLDRYLSGLPIENITRSVVDSLTHEKLLLVWQTLLSIGCLRCCALYLYEHLSIGSGCR